MCRITSSMSCIPPSSVPAFPSTSTLQTALVLKADEPCAAPAEARMAPVRISSHRAAASIRVSPKSKFVDSRNTENDRDPGSGGGVLSSSTLPTSSICGGIAGENAPVDASAATSCCLAAGSLESCGLGTRHSDARVGIAAKIEHKSWARISEMCVSVAFEVVSTDCAPTANSTLASRSHASRQAGVANSREAEGETGFIGRANAPAASASSDRRAYSCAPRCSSSTGCTASGSKMRRTIAAAAGGTRGIFCRVRQSTRARRDVSQVALTSRALLSALADAELPLTHKQLNVLNHGASSSHAPREWPARGVFLLACKKPDSSRCTSLVRPRPRMALSTKVRSAARSSVQDAGRKSLRGGCVRCRYSTSWARREGATPLGLSITAWPPSTTPTSRRSSASAPISTRRGGGRPFRLESRSSSRQN